ncbi:unnamed protein product [Rangifer tarandus platyrhynchus]|uniref:Uncharacterized protein n=1 Tax=Rangifer tarandus platyrhynchus TaxID=3082113 RepID=A0ABN8ZLJ8_RANTA|nr:unnamed protein product [Rangifer tarandus platyrhynchus]
MKMRKKLPARRCKGFRPHPPAKPHPNPLFARSTLLQAPPFRLTLFLIIQAPSCHPYLSTHPHHQPCVCVHAKSLQSCPTPCNPMNCSPPGSSVHGIFQA